MKENKDIIDFKNLLSQIIEHKKTFAIVMLVGFIVSAIYAFSLPRYYSCKVVLAPEITNDLNGGRIGSIMNAVGLNGNGGYGTDAIYPFLYPDVMESKEFTTALFSVNVQKNDGSLSTNYYDYLQKHQKKAWWTEYKEYFKSFFAEKKKQHKSNPAQISSFRLTKEQNSATETICDLISCSVDKKTDIITIVVKDQDPLICATLADTVTNRLQRFITDYRTKKSRIDLTYTQKIYDDARKEYAVAQAKYASFVNANRNLVSEYYITKKQTLENDVNLKHSNLSTASTQLQIAEAKVQEKTPAFTVIQGPSVPLLPSSPKRTIIVLSALIVSFIVSICVIFKSKLIDIID